MSKARGASTWSRNNRVSIMVIPLVRYSQYELALSAYKRVSYEGLFSAANASHTDCIRASVPKKSSNLGIL